MLSIQDAKFFTLVVTFKQAGKAVEMAILIPLLLIHINANLTVVLANMAQLYLMIELLLIHLHVLFAIVIATNVQGQELMNAYNARKDSISLLVMILRQQVLV